ncbi:flagellin N-terminal helical domain-containing protein [Leeia oryzae]|uniref:flagellin N-terminal helical domain-containing protein n=1 Tax=Leeia oryzae TaxID=356662 RepID=UPI00037EA97C|nr:flagellin [Leeia oryzae]
MALIVNTNVASLNAQRNLSTTSSALSTSLQRLSSGLRINSAKDDAAGLAIVEGLNSRVRGDQQAIRNANDGISLAQTGEGALGQIGNNLQRIREIAVQASNGTVSDTNRSQLQKEVDQLTQEISRIVTTTEFNGTHLFVTGAAASGIAAAGLTFQVGSDGSATNQVTIASGDLFLASGLGGSTTATSGGLNSYATSLTATGTISVLNTGAASATIAQIDADIGIVSNSRSTFGAIQNRFEAVIANLQNYVENLSASRSRIQDADFAEETAKLTRNQILQQAGTAILSQANSVPQQALSLLR